MQIRSIVPTLACLASFALIACGGSGQEAKGPESDPWSGYKGTYATAAEPRAPKEAPKTDVAQAETPKAEPVAEEKTEEAPAPAAEAKPASKKAKAAKAPAKAAAPKKKK
jgi:hypothetical protein